MIPIITIIGKSGSGKTTLLEKLVAELKHRSYCVATIKHHTKRGFEIDVPGKDSWRFARAGSDLVIIAAPDRIASYRSLERELSLDEITEGIHGVDIILVEGYKGSGKPAIEVLRRANQTELIESVINRIAIAADFEIEAGTPRFDLNDVVGIADFLENKYLPKPENNH